MSKAGGVLAASVTVRDDSFRLVTFLAGDTPPAWARARITNPRAWEVAPSAEPSPTPEAPEQTSPEEDFDDAPGEAAPVGDVGAGEAPASQAPSPAPETPAPAESTPETSQADEDLIGGLPARLPEPPKRGAGSGRDAWAAYARQPEFGITVTDAMTRDEIIDAVEAATPQQ